MFSVIFRPQIKIFIEGLFSFDQDFNAFNHDSLRKTSWKWVITLAPSYLPASLDFCVFFARWRQLSYCVYVCASACVRNALTNRGKIQNCKTVITGNGPDCKKVTQTHTPFLRKTPATGKTLRTTICKIYRLRFSGWHFHTKYPDFQEEYKESHTLCHHLII